MSLKIREEEEEEKEGNYHGKEKGGKKKRVRRKRIAGQNFALKKEIRKELLPGSN